MSVKKTLTNNYTINYKSDVVPQYSKTDTSATTTDFAVEVRRSGSDAGSTDQFGAATSICKRKSTAGSADSETITLLAWSAPYWDGANEGDLGAVYIVSSSAESSTGANGGTINRWGDDIHGNPALRLTTSLDTNPANGGSSASRNLGSAVNVWSTSYLEGRSNGLAVDCNIWDSSQTRYIHRVIAGASRHYDYPSSGGKNYIGAVHIWDFPAGTTKNYDVVEYVVTASTPTAGDEFGADVATVSNEYGSYFFVSEIGRDMDGKNSMGVVYAYAFDKSTNPHLGVATINSPLSESSANWATSLDADGTLLVGGMAGKNKVGIFKQTSSTNWIWVQTLTHPSGTTDAAGYRYGSNISISGDYLAVGAAQDHTTEGDANDPAGHVYIYKSGSSGFVLEDELYLTASGDTLTRGAKFGGSVSIDAKSDGSKYVAVGAEKFGAFLDEPGWAQIFKSGSGGWTEHKLLRPHGTAGNKYENLGCSVSLTGGVALIGAHGDRLGDDNAGTKTGQVYILDSTTVTTSTTEDFGYPFRFGAKTVSNIRGIGAGTDIKIKTADD